jgi:hypothetical protein
MRRLLTTRKQTNVENRFHREFGPTVCVGDSITADVGKFKVTAVIESDDDMGPPWEEHDGHGVVSDWVSRDKLPHERILAEDRGMCRYYDVKASMKRAIAEQWDAPPYRTGSRKQQAARAVDADFVNLKAWCAGEWFWGWMRLSVSVKGIVLDAHAAVEAGLQCNATASSAEFLTETANELLDEAIETADRILRVLCDDCCGDQPQNSVYKYPCGLQEGDVVSSQYFHNEVLRAPTQVELAYPAGKPSDGYVSNWVAIHGSDRLYPVSIIDSASRGDVLLRRVETNNKVSWE